MRIRLFSGLVALAALVAAACTDGGSAAAVNGPIEVRVARAGHALLVPVPWWWDGPPPGRDACPRRGDDPSAAPFEAPTTVAVLAIDRDGLRLGTTTRLAFDADAPPPTALAELPIAALEAALAPMITRHRAFLAACDRADAPIDLMLAVAPDVPQHAAMRALYTVRRAGVARIFLAVAGDAGARRWTPGGFQSDEVALELLRPDGAWVAQIAARPLAGSPGATLAGLPAILGDRRPGCATVEMRGGEPWAEIVAALDLVAGLGAHQFNLSAERIDPELRRPAAPAPGEALELRRDGVVAVLPLIAPKLIGVDEFDDLPTMHPCEGRYARTFRPPTPATLEQLEQFRRDLDAIDDVQADKVWGEPAQE